jgi:hypothetical protein
MILERPYKNEIPKKSKEWEWLIDDARAVLSYIFLEDEQHHASKKITVVYDKC